MSLIMLAKSLSLTPNGVSVYLSLPLLGGDTHKRSFSTIYALFSFVLISFDFLRVVVRVSNAFGFEF